MSESALSFEHDVKPLFRDSDRAAMSKAFDLWSATDVAAHGDAIVARLPRGIDALRRTLATGEGRHREQVASRRRQTVMSGGTLQHAHGVESWGSVVAPLG